MRWWRAFDVLAVGCIGRKKCYLSLAPSVKPGIRPCLESIGPGCDGRVGSLAMSTAAADCPPSGSPHSRTPADPLRQTRRCPRAANLPLSVETAAWPGRSRRFHKAVASITLQPPTQVRYHERPFSVEVASAPRLWLSALRAGPSWLATTGCRAWHRHRLVPPQYVRDAISAHVNANAQSAKWPAESCEQGGQVPTSAHISWKNSGRAQQRNRRLATAFRRTERPRP